MRTLKAEVEKSFVRTAVGHGLVILSRKETLTGCSAKGNRVNIPEPERRYRVPSLRRRVYGNVTEPEDVGGNPGKSSPSDHGICLPGDSGLAVGKALHFM